MPRGGKRLGAGRPQGSKSTVTKPDHLKSRMVSVRLPKWLADWLKDQPESSGRIIKRALIETYKLKERR